MPCAARFVSALGGGSAGGAGQVLARCDHDIGLAWCGRTAGEQLSVGIGEDIYRRVRVDEVLDLIPLHGESSQAPLDALHRECEQDEEHGGDDN